MWIENKIAVGTYIIRTIISEDHHDLVGKIHDSGFGVTFLQAGGYFGPKLMIYTSIPRCHIKSIMDLIHTEAPEAFITVEER
ncbi:MAG TPA: DUF2179 domain-containing protein [Flexilinea sp.]|nr:DUF2179 domain-containing protein [Flexilinea sp.]HPJ66016.1 DUF2179 domain-containing protein [Flexilinea sp.]HPR72011.1 DUF2179 domain-containing protein [Flexilinea sp.]